MNLHAIFIPAIGVAAAILIAILFAVVNFLSRGKRRARDYKEIAAKTNFKPIEADSHILKTNRFGDIIKNDFLALRDGGVKISGGIMKYNVDEHIVFCDCLVEALDNSGKKPRFFAYNAILHLRQNAAVPTLKVRLDSKVTNKTPVVFSDLKFSFQSDGFCFSSDTEIKSNAFSSDFLDVLKEYKNRFPFANLKQSGLLVLNAKGWFILSAVAAGQDMLENLMEFDRRIAEAFLKKHV